MENYKTDGRRNEFVRQFCAGGQVCYNGNDDVRSLNDNFHIWKLSTNAYLLESFKSEEVD